MALDKVIKIDKVEFLENDSILRVLKRIDIIEDNEVISVSYDAERYEKQDPSNLPSELQPYVKEIWKVETP